MHKKLEAELIHLAHQILKINKDTNIGELRDKSRAIYENLSVLSFIDDYFVETPEVTGSKEEFLKDLSNLSGKKEKTVKVKEVKEIEKKEETPVVEEIEPVSKKEDTDKLVSQTIHTIKSEAKEIINKIQETAKVEIPKIAETPKKEKSDFDSEMENSIPADVAADMFQKLEKAPKIEVFTPISEVKKIEKPVIEEIKIEKPKVNIATKQEVPEPKVSTPKTTSLNDRISNQKIQVGLNDRIAFVKHLFNFSQEDFNTVLSQLNSFQSEKECMNFITNDVKVKHDWAGKEEYENRLMTLIDRKFK